MENLIIGKFQLYFKELPYFIQMNELNRNGKYISYDINILDDYKKFISHYHPSELHININDSYDISSIPFKFTFRAKGYEEGISHIKNVNNFISLCSDSLCDYHSEIVGEVTDEDGIPELNVNLYSNHKKNINSKLKNSVCKCCDKFDDDHLCELYLVCSDRYKYWTDNHPTVDELDKEFDACVG